MPSRLDTLLLHHPGLWRADAQLRARRPAIPTGCAGLDARLPGGGWPLAALIEVLHEGPGVGELDLFVPYLRHLGRADGVFAPVMAWVDPPHIPYAPALGARAVDPMRQLIIRSDSPGHALWAMEQALRSGACSAVLGWADKVEMRWLRRLKLAAVDSGGAGILFRPLRWRAQASPATVRVALVPDTPAMKLEVLKVQGGKPGSLPWR
jgi:hypothetical protein